MYGMIENIDTKRTERIEGSSIEAITEEIKKNISKFINKEDYNTAKEIINEVEPIIEEAFIKISGKSKEEKIL